MRKITNKYGLPETLVNLAKSKNYTRGNSDRSITQLIDSPRVSTLRVAYKDNIEEDVTDTFWANLGSALHYITEKGADKNHIVEERLFVNVGGWKISGAIDVQKIEDNNTISVMDYKFTSVWAVKNPKLDWERQLNCYAFLVRESKNVEIDKLQVVAFLRDWNRNNAKRDESYPQQQIMVVPINLWSYKEQTDYIKDRVKKHRQALQGFTLGKGMPECSPEERWQREDTYAVKKIKNVRALKVFDNEQDAKKFAKEKGKEYEIEKRIGLPVRCVDNYCKVNHLCSQHKKWQEQQTLNG